MFFSPNHIPNENTFHRDCESEHDPSAGISDAWVIRRPFRSTSSVHTAFDTQGESLKVNPPPKRRQRHTCRSASRSKQGSPLFEDSIRISGRACRCELDLRARTEITALSRAIDDVHFSMSLAYPCARKEHDSQSASADVIPAHSLLSLAKKTVELDSDWFGGKSCIMDVILDLKDLARSSRDTLMSRVTSHQLYEEPHCGHSMRQTYTIYDRTALDTYWKHRESIISALWVSNDNSGVMGFPESAERSTATWSASLNDDSPICLPVTV